jgi:hypothetical protein
MAPDDWTAKAARGTNGGTVLFMLVDTREPGDDGSGSSREPWLVSMLEWIFPWPALIIWLLAASQVLHNWIGVVFAYAAIGLTAWRGLRALPNDGLRDSRQ